MKKMWIDIIIFTLLEPGNTQNEITTHKHSTAADKSASHWGRGHSAEAPVHVYTWTHRILTMKSLDGW